MTRWALLSVTDKSGVDVLARELAALGFSLLSSGGTARFLREAGVAVTDVAEHTGSPEILGGRVKTLHPRIHGGILARPDHAADAEECRRHDIPGIDLVVVNLYRFEQAAAGFALPPGAALTEPGVAAVLEEIDIGGPTLLRAAAKNAGRVAVVVDPADYPAVAAALRERSEVPPALRARLAAKAFRMVAEYDMAIARFFEEALLPAEAPAGAGALPAAEAEGGELLPAGARPESLPPDAGLLLQGDLPPSLASLPEEDVETSPRRLRYGENPHQRAFFLRGRDPGEASVLHAKLRRGKKLSYNNLWDAEAALAVVKDFDAPCACVVKHANPCGAAVAESIEEAYQRAREGDPVSAFGGILALNRGLDRDLAERIAARENFFEVLVVPEASEAALRVFAEHAAWGKNLRVLECGPTSRRGASRPAWNVRALVGGVLVQERDVQDTFTPTLVTRRRPTAQEEADLEVAWRLVRHVHSNAIVFVKDGMLVGTGAGQMSRVDSVGLAAEKAGARARGAVMASDAFFPFRDGVERALAAGVTAVIQPGGSRRDREVIEACDTAGAAMFFTGHRHFRH